LISSGVWFFSDNDDGREEGLEQQRLGGGEADGEEGAAQGGVAEPTGPPAVPGKECMHPEGLIGAVFDKRRRTRASSLLLLFFLFGGVPGVMKAKQKHRFVYPFFELLKLHLFFPLLLFLLSLL
jgi:hypothetical protein